MNPGVEPVAGLLTVFVGAMVLRDFLTEPRLTDRLKDEGKLVHDHATGRWITLPDHDEDPLPCSHIDLEFRDGSMRCRRCGCSRPTSISPEPSRTVIDVIREVRDR